MAQAGAGLISDAPLPFWSRLRGRALLPPPKACKEARKSAPFLPQQICRVAVLSAVTSSQALAANRLVILMLMCSDSNCLGGKASCCYIPDGKPCPAVLKAMTLAWHAGPTHAACSGVFCWCVRSDAAMPGAAMMQRAGEEVRCARLRAGAAIEAREGGRRHARVPVAGLMGVHGGRPHVAVMVHGRRRWLVAVPLRRAHGPAPHAGPWSPTCATCH